jgi:hypothetical protein
MKTSQFLTIIGTVWIAPHSTPTIGLAFGMILLVGSLYMISKND